MVLIYKEDEDIIECYLLIRDLFIDFYRKFLENLSII